MGGRVEQPVSFYQDDGLRIDGDLYSSAETPRLGIVFCHGWGGTRGATAPGIARGLTSRLPASVLVFDYTGWGTSEGPRERLDPEREIADVRCAVSYLLATQPELSGRVGLFGLSFGGSIATSAAGRDERVRALMAGPAAASGERLGRGQREHWKQIGDGDRVEADRVQRVVRGPCQRAD